MRLSAPILVCASALAGFFAVSPDQTASQNDARKLPEVWLEIPEANSQIEANGFVQLPTVQISYLQLHINKQPAQITYGSIHVKVNTESANTILTVTSKPEGLLCNLDLKHFGGFEFVPGRNSVEVEFSDPYRRIHYASFLVQLAEKGVPAKLIRTAAPQKVEGTKYAVVVGISKYQYAGAGLTNLRFADRDARAFRDFLESPAGGAFPKENVLSLFDEDATAKNVYSALRTFLTKPRSQDLVVIYFAGHGAADPNDNRNLYLLTYDTDPNDMGGTAFPMEQLQDIFARIIKAKRVVSFSDSCHSYGISGERLGGAHHQNNLVNQYMERYAAQRDYAVITASNISELSYEDEKWGGGVFTHYLLKGLQGEADRNKDGTVTAAELFAYLQEKVPEATGGQQNPRYLPGLAQDLALSGVGAN